MTGFPLIKKPGMGCNAYRGCLNPAQYIVVIHVVHNCAKAGDTIWMMCQFCRDTTLRRIGELVGEMFTVIPDGEPEETVPACEGCGRFIHDVDDLMTVQELV